MTLQHLRQQAQVHTALWAGLSCNCTASSEMCLP
jgi:hypothetical protein